MRMTMPFTISVKCASVHSKHMKSIIIYYHSNALCMYVFIWPIILHRMQCNWQTMFGTNAELQFESVQVHVICTLPIASCIAHGGYRFEWPI